MNIGHSKNVLMIELKQMFEEAYTTALVLYRKPLTFMTFMLGKCHTKN